MLFAWHGERTDIFIKLVLNCMWWLTQRHTQSGSYIYFKYMKNDLKSLCFLHLKIAFSLRNMLGTASHITKSSNSDFNNFIIQSTNALSFVTYSVMSDSLRLWTVAHQTPLSTEFSRQEFWSGLPCPPPGILPSQGLNPGLPIAGGFFTIWATRETHCTTYIFFSFFFFFYNLHFLIWNITY